MNNNYADLVTENVNPQTRDIDLCSTEEMVRLINREDMNVPLAVEKETGHNRTGN